jgi:hypothetical protein
MVYAKSGRTDLDPPPINLAVEYYRSRAPDQPVFPEPEEAVTELRARFSVRRLSQSQPADVPPAISHLRWTRLGKHESPVLLACDMRYGTVTSVDLNDRSARRRVLAELNHPCHVEPCDLDADGAVDLTVADLGSFLPIDHDRGRVVWLRRQPGTGYYQEVVVASGLGRVADLRPVDVDGDRDLDLIVSEFGHDETGSILLLRNVSEIGARPHFEPEELDPRPGAIHVPVHDLNEDGHPDFVALMSQQYESVEAFINRGEGKFYRQTLWAASDPAFGSSGIELVDMDRDGDLDVLYTNGDSFAGDYVKPCFGVQWLENLGDVQFSHHRLTDLLCVYRALAGDVDLDGDVDVVAVASVSPQIKPAILDVGRLPSIVCLEQASPGKFVRHTLLTVV